MCAGHGRILSLLETYDLDYFPVQPSILQSRLSDKVKFCRPMCYKKCAREMCFFQSDGVRPSHKLHLL